MGFRTVDSKYCVFPQPRCSVGIEICKSNQVLGKGVFNDGIGLSPTCGDWLSTIPTARHVLTAILPTLHIRKVLCVHFFCECYLLQPSRTRILQKYPQSGSVSQSRAHIGKNCLRCRKALLLKQGWGLRIGCDSANLENTSGHNSPLSLRTCIRQPASDISDLIVRISLAVGPQRGIGLGS
jgi:hypothetical protein